MRYSNNMVEQAHYSNDKIKAIFQLAYRVHDRRYRFHNGKAGETLFIYTENNILDVGQHDKSLMPNLYNHADGQLTKLKIDMSLRQIFLYLCTLSM